jgi:demethylmenaquinone methyltransferase/2-methoxy-6-polyprenyl-1,4-benzoquinol methylase
VSTLPEDKAAYVHKLFAGISDKYDLMNDIESLGLHRLWKANLVRKISAVRPTRVLDIATGTGDIAIAIARQNPQAKVTGLDFSQEMLAEAKRRIAIELPYTWQISSDSNGKAAARRNLELICGNAMDLPFESDSFDAVSVSFGLRNMPDYAVVLAEIYRVLKSGGLLLCLDASYPTAPVIKPAFRLYFKYWLPVVAQAIAKKPEEYRWLNDSTEAFLSKPELLDLITQVGFEQSKYRSFLMGAAALHSAIKPFPFKS